MRCLRCGYCCSNLAVVIVDDPKKGLVEGNVKIIGLDGPERCPHLKGEVPGEFECAVHGYPWYQDTPCAQYQSHRFVEGQECPMGKRIVSQE